jgi:hypothetical protein
LIISGVKNPGPVGPGAVCISWGATHPSLCADAMKGRLPPAFFEIFSNLKTGSQRGAI